MLGTLLSWSLARVISTCSSYRTGAGLLVSGSTVPGAGLSEDWRLLVTP